MPVLVALVVTAAAAASTVRATTLTPNEDVSLPFFCDWGYDWEERCYSDDSTRLALGGEAGKVWRSALRFPLDAIPLGAPVVTAELSLWYDRTCIASLKRFQPCDGRAFDLEAHRILTARWFSEREVETDPTAFGAELPPGAATGWVTFDVTDLVADWHSGGVPNNGLLLQLAPWQESEDVPGPSLPSSAYPDATLGPRLTVWWLAG